MKKLLLIATSWMIFSGCAKTVKSPDEKAAVNNEQTQAAMPAPPANQTKPVRVIAQVQYTGPVAEGGYGWILALDKGTWVAPSNLPVDLQREGIFVDATYYFTNKPVPNYKGTDPRYYVYITNIFQVKGQGGQSSGN